MNKVAIALVVAGVALVGAVAPAAAQSEAAIIKVPFQFIVGERVLPPGTYRVAPQSLDGAVVNITNLKDTTLSVFVPTQGLGNPESTGTQSQATFVNYDGHYFLRTVALPGRDGREVVMITKATAERTLAKLNLLNAEPANVAK